MALFLSLSVLTQPPSGGCIIVCIIDRIYKFSSVAYYMIYFQY